MIDGPTIATLITSAGFTHLIWIPDSTIGRWEAAFQSADIPLIRPTREGEAIALAGGLILGGAKPLVLMQCTGLFEAGDALRNVVYDLGMALKLLIGVRSYRAHVQARTTDNCPIFTEPILNAWKIPYSLLVEPDAEAMGRALDELSTAPTAQAILLGE